MKEIKLKIEGMHCAGCSTRLERVLNNLEGVEEAKVSLEEKQQQQTRNLQVQQIMIK